MISNQILQSTIDGLKGISRMDFSVADTEGNILASTYQSQEIGSSEILGLHNHRRTARWFVDINFLKYMMKIVWNIL